MAKPRVGRDRPGAAFLHPRPQFLDLMLLARRVFVALVYDESRGSPNARPRSSFVARHASLGATHRVHSRRVEDPEGLGPGRAAPRTRLASAAKTRVRHTGTVGSGVDRRHSSRSTAAAPSIHSTL